MKTMKQILSVAATGLMAVMTMTGCGSNNSNSTPSVVNPYGAYGACTACTNAGIGTLATTVTATDVENEQLSLQIYSNSATPYTYSASYGAQVAASGVIVIPQSWMSCGIPAGQYTLQPYQQPGTWSGSTITNLTLVGTGPTTIMVQMNNVYFTAPNRVQINGAMYGQGAQAPCQLTMF